MSSTLQQFAKVIDEVRKSTNTPELCHNRLELSSPVVALQSFRWFAVVFLPFTPSLPPSLSLSCTLSSWVPVMLSCPPSLQMPWCFQSLSLKRETWRVGNIQHVVHWWAGMESVCRWKCKCFWYSCQIRNQQGFRCPCSPYITVHGHK